jgi:hypothetical protein
MGFVVNSSLGRNYSQERTILTHGEESVLKNKLFVVALSNQGLDDSLVRQGLLALSISASAISDVTTWSKAKGRICWLLAMHDLPNAQHRNF